jgi:hypothetical protein
MEGSNMEKHQEEQEVALRRTKKEIHMFFLKA